MLLPFWAERDPPYFLFVPSLPVLKWLWGEVTGGQRKKQHIHLFPVGVLKVGGANLARWAAALAEPLKVPLVYIWFSMYSHSCGWAWLALCLQPLTSNMIWKKSAKTAWWDDNGAVRSQGGASARLGGPGWGVGRGLTTWERDRRPLWHHTGPRALNTQNMQKKMTKTATTGRQHIIYGTFKDIQSISLAHSHSLSFKEAQSHCELL